MKKFIAKVLFFLKPLFEESKEDLKKKAIEELTPYVEEVLKDVKVSKKKINEVIDSLIEKLDKIF